MTGVAFLLFTFYMVTDPATTPVTRRGQIAFGAVGGRGLRAPDVVPRRLRPVLRPHPGLRRPRRCCSTPRALAAQRAEAKRPDRRCRSRRGPELRNEVMRPDRDRRDGLPLSRRALARRAVGERARPPPRLPAPAAGAAAARGLPAPPTPPIPTASTPPRRRCSRATSSTASRFRVAGDTFRSADLAHWLALDVAAQALADAGFPDGEGLPRDTTGVLLGNTLTGEFSRANLMRLRWPYVRRTLDAAARRRGLGRGAGRRTSSPAWRPPTRRPSRRRCEETLAGGLSNTIAGRHLQPLRPPRRRLHRGRRLRLVAAGGRQRLLGAGRRATSTSALAGGVDLWLDPFELVGFAKAGALAHGEMRVYDARSAGFLPGEGCGFVVLMRESDAERLGAGSYAVHPRLGDLLRRPAAASPGPRSRGSSWRCAAPTAAPASGSRRSATSRGTAPAPRVGDATELDALDRAPGGRRRPTRRPRADRLDQGEHRPHQGRGRRRRADQGGPRRPRARSCPRPPAATSRTPSSRATGAGAARPRTSGEPWPPGRPLRAGVSAMGFGGINAHVVLEGAPRDARRRALAARGARPARLLARTPSCSCSPPPTRTSLRGAGRAPGA